MTRIMTRISEKNRTALLLLGLCLLLGTGRALGLSEADIQEGGGGQEQRDDPRNTSSHTSHTLCRQQMKIGWCRAAFPRFYYDVTNQSCRSFTWGGCGANGNNFKTREECEDTCRGVTGSVLPDESLPAKDPRMRVGFSKKVSQDVQSEPVAKESAPALEKGMSAADFAERCGAEPLTGPCRASFQNWYYNSKTGGCQSFIYGGCGGNKNNYDSQESCMANCTVQVLPSSRKVAAADDNVDSMREYEAHCLVPADGGFCRGFFPMFYYDAPTASCQSFTYGGCQGNKNRYDTVEECMKRCSGGAFDTREKRRDRWTPAVFLFVTLAAVSALLLASLVIITLRRHRLTRRPSSISDKEELLPDPDEPSVETLTVPESPKPDQA